MKLPALLFIFIIYGLFLEVYSGGIGNESDFPTFEAPDLDFRDVPTSCSGFLDCTEYVGDIIVNFVLGVVYVVLLLFEIIRVLVLLLVLAATNSFTGFDGAPVWFNVVILAAFGIAFGMAIYRTIRKGDTAA